MVKEIWEPVTERLGGDSHPCRTYYKSPRPAECGREAGRDVAAALIEVRVRNDVFGEAIDAAKFRTSRHLQESWLAC